MFRLTKEPGRVHVEAPGCLVTTHELVRLLVKLTVVNSEEVFHQHIVDMLGRDVLDAAILQ